jgi:hypothetical protein
MAPFDLDACIDRLRDKQLLGEALLREICEKTKEVLMRESNVVHVSSPVTVVGDIHGQFHDLIEIFRIGGPAPTTNYLFLGECPGLRRARDPFQAGCGLLGMIAWFLDGKSSVEEQKGDGHARTLCSSVKR